MPIYQATQTPSTIPGIKTVIQPPATNYLSPAQTDLLGVVGTAAWGPVNAPTPVNGYADFVTKFGAQQNRARDLGTAVNIATQQGSQHQVCVRVTDGTDVAATATVQTNGLTATSKYTGSGGNGDTLQLAPGNQSATWAVTINHPGLPTETFQNIGAGLSGNALWQAIAAAVNSGTSLRGPSQIMVLSAGAATTALTAQTVTLAGGTDGASGVTDTTLVGVDSAPRTGMYALRKAGCSVGMLADCTSASAKPAQVTFGLSEGVYMIGVGPQGDTISNAVSTKSTAGLDSYAYKELLGDWCYWLDSVNGVPSRLVSPQAFIAGWIAANGPQNSSLNKPLEGIIATQKSSSLTVYQDDEIATLEAAGIDVIVNPSQGGSYFGAVLGHNSSSNQLIRGDNYTRMTNFIAETLNQGLGPYVGLVGTSDVVQEAKTELDAYFNDLWTATPPAIGTSDPKAIPWLVTMDTSQLPQGILKAYVKVIFGPIIEQFLVYVQGGQSVQITRVSTTSAV